jgi:hypothetical protein
MRVQKTLVRLESAVLNEDVLDGRPLELLAAREADEMRLVSFASVPAHASFSLHVGLAA